jgi:hypothetical protein
MKRVILSVIALVVCLAAQAQDIRVNYTGNRPTINDFVTAVLSQDDLGESLDDVKNNWERYQQGKPLAEGSGASFTVDVKNGYVRYEKHLTQKTYGYTEFCYWNCQDARHKLVAVNNGFFAEGQPITTQFSGLTFYTYDNQTKTMTLTSAEDLGAGIHTSAVVGYALPQAGKDIMAVIYAPQGEIQILMKWNGAKFDQQMLGVPDGNVQVSAPASRITGSFGETIQRNGEECIRVYTAEQFLNAIGSYRHILVAKNTEINLTPILNDQSLFRTRFMMWMPDASGGIGGDRATVVSEEVFDGRQLTMVNMKQLIIEGEGNSRIVVEPRYAFCLNFVDCEQCTVSNLTIGHTVGGSCTGGVVGVSRGRNNTVIDCDLYGCGAYGLQLSGTQNFALYSSKIRDCTYGIMTLEGCEAARFTHCDFYGNKEYALIESHGSIGTVFEDCRFYANWGDAALFSFDREFILLGCAIYHPTENLGTMDFCSQPSKSQPNRFYPNPYDQDLQGRGIGPDSPEADGKGE